MTKINVCSWMFFCFFLFFLFFYSINGGRLTLTCSWNAINEGRAGGWMWYTISEQNNITAYLKAGLGLCFLFPQRLQNTSRIAPKSQLLLFPLNMEMVLLCFTLAFVQNSTSPVSLSSRSWNPHKGYFWLTLLFRNAFELKSYLCQKILKS